MRAFRCAVDIQIEKENGFSATESQIWIVQSDGEDGAERKIYRHFKEYHLLKGGRKISSIHFMEIRLDGATDLEEYLEAKEDATVNVLF